MAKKIILIVIKKKINSIFKKKVEDKKDFSKKNEFKNINKGININKKDKNIINNNKTKLKSHFFKKKSV